MNVTARKLSKLLSRKGIYPFITSEVSALSRNALVLNVGAGGDVQAHLENLARTSGISVVHSDIDPNRRPAIVDDISRSTFAERSFDAVIMIEVLEHVRQPQQAADEIFRLLKPGGRVILTTPFIFPIHDRPYDFFRFTKYGLAALFSSYESVIVSERNSWSESLLVLLTRLGRGSGRRGRLINLAAFPLCVLLWPFAILVGRVFRSDYITTGYTLSARRPSSNA